MYIPAPGKYRGARLVKFLALIAALLSGACSTVTPLKAINNPDLNLQDGPGDNDRFEALLGDFAIDSTTLLGRAGELNAAEAAFSLGLLAAASYGAYSTTYGGNNLKDAAFAAASLTGLRSLITPGQRRNAARVAAIRLNCLARAAEPFKGDYSLGSAAAAGAFDGVVKLNASGYSGFSSVETLKSALLAGAEMSSPMAGFAAGAPAAVENARRESLAQSIAENVVQSAASE